MPEEGLGERRAEGHVGLTLLRQLVEDAGGALSISSAPGEGTTLYAEIPVQ
jgi:signal transduction histidine kinase